MGPEGLPRGIGLAGTEPGWELCGGVWLPQEENVPSASGSCWWGCCCGTELVCVSRHPWNKVLSLSEGAHRVLWGHQRCCPHSR